MRKFLAMSVLVSLFSVAADAEVLTLKKDASISVIAKFAGAYPVDILAMNPELDGGAIVKAKQKILYVSQDDKSNALAFCQRELWRISRGEKDTYLKTEIERAEAILKARPLVISYAPGKEGLPYAKVLEYAKAYHQRHAKKMK